MKSIGALIALVLAIAAIGHSQHTNTGGLENKIVYVEFQSADLAQTKAFFEKAFGWNFADQAPNYITFFDGRMAGGFMKTEKAGRRSTGGALLSLYSENLEDTLRKVEASGGKITEPIVSSAGGRRFVFEEPSGNEFAVVSSK